MNRRAVSYSPVELTDHDRQAQTRAAATAAAPRLAHRPGESDWHREAQKAAQRVPAALDESNRKPVMGQYTYAPKADANHADIVAAYEALHCGVIDTHKQGFGFPDILVHFSGYCAPVEIKVGDAKLEAAQERFQRDWKGPRIEVVRCVDDVIAHVQRIRAKRGAP